MDASVFGLRMRLVGLVMAGCFGAGVGAWSGTHADELAVFALAGEQSLLEEAHCGIVNGRLTVGIPHRDVAGVDGLWAPPYVSSDFRLEVRVGGQTAATERYTWWPFQVARQGSVQDVRIRTTTALVPGKRAGVLAVTLDNASAQARNIPVTVRVQGTLDRNDTWEFAAPVSRSPTTPAIDGGTLLLQHDTLAIAVQGPAATVRGDAASGAGEAVVPLPPNGRATVSWAWAVGPRSEALADCRGVAADPAGAVEQAVAAHRQQVRELFERLPRLESSNAALVQLYDRSLVHFLTNRWDVPEFALRPYYSTGSVRGGCVCNYLWNFGETWELLPLYDPAAVRTHIEQFLQIDLTAHFAFLPITGQGFGPWYMVNQEKIIGLVYYYVKHTGDVAFLSRVVAGRTILEHVIAHALYGDDPSRPVALIDYGPSNSHLELRRGYPYNHTMPDLNGRRYANYCRAAELADAAGQPAPNLRERAAALRTLLKQELWNPQTRWFDFRNGQGQKDTRYTIQMFKLFASDVLDREQEAGLLSHLQEREFLGEFGLHSLAKSDIAYDQVDIDNGGGGSCTCFPPQIAERLYKAGRPEVAEDLLRRIVWWGERLPYWGDSLVANRLDYRRDTPLQCTLDGVTVAQCMVFGLFGISPQFDGSVLVRPHPPSFAERVALRGLKLRGLTLDITADHDHFTVTSDGETSEAPVGQTVTIKAAASPRRT